MSDRPSEAIPSLTSQPAGPPADAESTDNPSPPAKAGARQRSMVREIIETLLLALLIFLAVRAVVLNFRVDGHSMDHSLQNNEMLLVNRNSYLTFDQNKWLGWIPGTDFEEGDTWQPFGTPERGDIVVLTPPQEYASANKPYIKRVIGVAGDHLEIRTNAEGIVEGVYIDGVKLDEPYLDEGMQYRCTGRFCDPLDVPEGYVFVMGDNRGNSEDSRYFGLVPIDSIIGKAWVTYWPVGEIGVIPHEDYPELGES
jgi:signal peptidase I